MALLIHCEWDCPDLAIAEQDGFENCGAKHSTDAGDEDESGKAEGINSRFAEAEKAKRRKQRGGSSEAQSTDKPVEDRVSD